MFKTFYGGLGRAAIMFIVWSAMINTIGSSILPQCSIISEFPKPIVHIVVIPVKPVIMLDSLMDSIVVAKIIVYKKWAAWCEQDSHLLPGFLLGLIHGESAGDKRALSKANAKGIVQFTEIALRDVRRITGRRINPYKAREAIWAAAKFVRYYADKYKLRYDLSDYESIKYAAIYYLGGDSSVRAYRDGIVVYDKYTGVSVSDYADMLLKRTQLYHDMFYGNEG